MKKEKQRRVWIMLAAFTVFAIMVYAAAGPLKNKYFLAGAKETISDTQTEPEPFLSDSGSGGTVELNGKTYGYEHDIQSFLFIGTDASGNESAEGEAYRGNMADFLLLAVVDGTSHTYAALQLNRDTMADVTLLQHDGTGMAEARLQICTAHWYGGTPEQSCENTVEAVSTLLGKIPIDGYYALNMEQIPDLNHAVGGVPVTVEDDFSDVDPTLKKGETITLSDEQAYTFLHDRYEVGDEKNLSRMARQRQYMKNWMVKVEEKKEDQSDFILQLFDEMESKAVTNISGKMLSKLAKQISNSESKGVFTLEGKSKTGKALDDGRKHAEFYVDSDSLCKVMTNLYTLKE